MNTGLPGTGIGGLFYLILSFFMFFLESRKYLNGRRNTKRMRLVFEELMIAVSIVFTIFITNVVLSRIFFKKIQSAGSQSGMLEKIYFLVQSYPIIVPVLLLVLVLSFVQIISLCVKIRETKK